MSASTPTVVVINILTPQLRVSSTHVSFHGQAITLCCPSQDRDFSVPVLSGVHFTLKFNVEVPISPFAHLEHAPSVSCMLSGELLWVGVFEEQILHVEAHDGPGSMDLKV